jgi:hypothetical protein
VLILGLAEQVEPYKFEATNCLRIGRSDGHATGGRSLRQASERLHGRSHLPLRVQARGGAATNGRSER